MEKLSYIEKYIKTDEYKNNDYIVENTYNMILLFKKNNIKITTGLEYLWLSYRGHLIISPLGL